MTALVQGPLMSMVTLKNETQIPMAILKTTLRRLEAVIHEKKEAIFALIQACNQPSISVQGEFRDILKRHVLITEEGRVSDLVQSIVLSAVETRAQEVCLVSPLRSAWGTI